MTHLPADLRAGLRAWADRPPRRDATSAARLARAAADGGRDPGRGQGRAPLRIAAATLAASACFALGLTFAWRLGSDAAGAAPPGALGDAVRPTAGAGAHNDRVVVIELSSGTPLYVVLPPAAARSNT
jgi:hypothetical protein